MLRDKIDEVCGSLIYHSRHFSPKRDEVVLKKSSDYILSLFTLKGWMWVTFVPYKRQTKVLQKNGIEYVIRRRILFVQSKDWERSRELLGKDISNREAHHSYEGG